MSKAYSFLDVVASITGPGGSFSLSEGGIADEGIVVTMSGDKNTMITGASGDGMHSLHAAQSGRITVRVLKNGAVNAKLNALYRHQIMSSASWGQNQISVRNPSWGDSITAVEGAFVKHPDHVDAKEGGIQEWTFDFVKIDMMIGTGSPSIIE